MSGKNQFLQEGFMTTSIAVQMFPIIDEKPHARVHALIDALATMRNPEEIRKNLRDLIGIMKEHFHEEETIMENIYYPAREEHMRSHAWLLSRAEALLIDVAHSPEPQTLVTRMLCEPMERHTHKYDDPMLLAACATY